MPAPTRSARAAVVILVFGAATVFAGCGSPPTFHSAAKLAKAMGCQHFVPGAPAEENRYAEIGACDINGAAVTIVSFTNDQLRDNYRRLYAESTAHIAGSSHWIALSPELVDSVASRIQAPIRALGCC
jgi:hypothetical protein